MKEKDTHIKREKIKTDMIKQVLAFHKKQPCIFIIPIAWYPSNKKKFLEKSTKWAKNEVCPAKMGDSDSGIDSGLIPLVLKLESESEPESKIFETLET